MDKILNLSSHTLNKLYSWIPHDLQYEKIVFFPDVCPGRSLLPTGTAVITRQEDWRKYAVSDIGCGMLMSKSSLKLADYRQKEWDEVLSILKNNKEEKGQLGSGNHFLDLFCSLRDESLYFVIHTGSRLEGNGIEDLIDNPKMFDKKYESIVLWAKENRYTINGFLERVYGKLDIVLDKPHNTYKLMEDGSVLIRKGSVELNPGDITIIPSSIDGDMVMVRGTDKISDCLNSLSHGTGRKYSRSDAKTYAEQYNYEALRRRIYIPDSISNASIKTEAPFCYRSINDCMNLLGDIVEEVERFVPIAYIGQL